MQAAILIQNGGVTVQKRVYGGDISSATMAAYVTALQIKYPTYTVTSFTSDQDSTFLAA